MTKLYIEEISKCNDCPAFYRAGYCSNVRPPHQIPIKIEQWEDENGKHDHRHYPIPEWCPLPDKEV